MNENVKKYKVYKVPVIKKPKEKVQAAYSYKRSDISDDK